eukprot:12060907-Alexandrium_andersonii.AAC.1
MRKKCVHARVCVCACVRAGGQQTWPRLVQARCHASCVPRREVAIGGPSKRSKAIAFSPNSQTSVRSTVQS